ncbi:MAG: TonB family protein [Pseudomonadota bacterium]
MMQRVSMAITSSGGITVALLALMTMLIQGGKPIFTKSVTHDVLRIVTPAPAPPKPIRNQPPEPIDKPVGTPTQGPEGPPIRLTPVQTTANPDGNGINVPLVLDPGPTVTGLPGTTRDNAALVTIIAVEPIYPQRMLQRGIEGYVDVRYGVDQQGRAINVEVTARSHPGFERAALKALERFRYQPRVIDGRAVVVSGLEKRFTFEIEQ